VQDFKGSN